MVIKGSWRQGIKFKSLEDDSPRYSVSILFLWYVCFFSEG